VRNGHVRSALQAHLSQLRLPPRLLGPLTSRQLSRKDPTPARRGQRRFSLTPRALGTGELVSSESHEEQIGPSLVGLGVPTDTCPKSVCREQVPTAYFGIGTVVLGGWVMQKPQFFGYGGVQAYLPSEDLAIAAEATLDEDAEEGLNGGQKVFEEIAAVLAPDHPPKP
jgi:hypothetical protein